MMRLREPLSVVSLSAAVMIGPSCHANPAQPSCLYTINPSTISVGPAGGPTAVSVTSGASCTWSVTSGADWIVPGGASVGTGSGSFTVQVVAQTGTAARSGSVSVGGQAVTVNQAGIDCTYSIQPATRSVGAVATSAAIDVVTEAPCEWSVVSDQPWLTVTGAASWVGPGTITYAVAQHSALQSRTGTLTAGGATHVVTQERAEQFGCWVALDHSGERFPSAGGAGVFSVRIADGCTWRVGTDQDWVHLTGPPGGRGYGPGTVTYVVDASAESCERYATIDVSGVSVGLLQAGSSSCTTR